MSSGNPADLVSIYDFLELEANVSGLEFLADSFITFHFSLQSVSVPGNATASFFCYPSRLPDGLFSNQKAQFG
jgi:hypothetical protein